MKNNQVKKDDVAKAVGLVPRTGAFAARFGIDWFLIALIFMILLAFLFPEIGVSQDPVSLSTIANYGISLIFLFYGLRLSPAKLKVGLLSWRLHLTIQLSTFLLFPLLILPFYPLFEGGNREAIWLGTFYLAALPSTVSSSVVMVSIAGGNITGAIFNASISSLLGIVITPLWMSLFLASNLENFDLNTIIGKLVLQVLLPVLIGILLHRYWGAFAERNKNRLRVFDQIIILLIVFTSFSESFARKMFSNYTVVDILMLGVAMIALFFIMYAIINTIARVMGFGTEDRITAIFCGSKKSLVHGTVMSKVLFPGSNLIGIILLPIMLYHAFQLLSASIIARRMAQK